MNLDRAVNVLTYIFGMALNLALLAIAGFAVYSFANWGFNFGAEFAEGMVARGEVYEVEFHLEEDTHISIVAGMLEEQGLIHNRWAFQFERFLVGSNPIYRAGTYTLCRSMSNTEINIALRQRPEERAGYHVVRIREGWTLEDMAEYFEYREFFAAEAFLYVAQNGHFAFPFLMALPPDTPNRLEGYLFPDTYHFPLSPIPGGVITQMLRRFDEIFEESYFERAGDLGLSQHQVIILASVIEAAASLPSELPLVSQVLHRQLELPDSPVSNPSLAAIEAALWPAATDYTYFVVADADTGRLRFGH
jgi:cell division protein YceG involved in septum cleavage